MLKHIVIFKLGDENSNQKKHLLKDKLEQLKNKISELKYLETGLNISKSPSAFDIILITEFESEDDLETYRAHPDHQEVVGFIKQNNIKTVVVDYSL